MKIVKTPIFLKFIASGLIFTGGVLLLSRPQNPGYSQAPIGSEISYAAMEPSNYCESCHTKRDIAFTEAVGWAGGIERTAINPCPASTRLQEEIFYTERLLLGIDKGRTYLGDSVDSGSLDRRIATLNEGYARILDAPVESLDSFIGESMNLRYQAGKVYSQIQQLVEAKKRQRVLAASILISIIVVISFTWGFFNTRKAEKAKKQPAGISSYIFWAAVILIIFGLFTLPLFRSFSQQTVSANPEIQTALDTSQRMASAADNSQARAWMFGKIGAAQMLVDEDKAEESLNYSLEAATEAERNNFALWGEASSAYEISVEDPVLLEKADLIASQLNSTRSRAWSLALTAAEWEPVNPAQSEDIYEQSLQIALQGQGIYRDLDLRRIAVSWASINLERAIETVHLIQDPALRSWGLREIGALNSDEALFDQAAEAARQVEDPINKSRLLSKIGIFNKDKALFNEALTILKGLPESETALALSDLAAASGDIQFISEISSSYPQAKALALFRLGQYKDAWEAAEEISDDFERAHAQAAIAAGWAEADGISAAAAAEEIQIPILRERAMRDVIRTTGDASLVEKLNIAYYRVQALTALAQYESAWEQAKNLLEPYPLMNLGINWASTDPEAAESVLDVLKREADKAPVLRALSAVTEEQSLFERALGMALAARVRNDVLAPARASLDLAMSFKESKPEWAEKALDQALEITQRISIK